MNGPINWSLMRLYYTSTTTQWWKLLEMEWWDCWGTVHGGVTADHCSNHVPLQVSIHAYVTLSLKISSWKTTWSSTHILQHSPHITSRPTLVKRKMRYATYSDLCPYTGVILTKIRQLKISNTCWFTSSMLATNSLYRPSILHMPLASVHHTVMNAFKGTKPVHTGH
jgi:hypothetical protein